MSPSSANSPSGFFRTRQIVGKYRIIRRIGEGGFATVYEATDTIEGTRVALKVPKARVLDEAVLIGIRREIRLIARLDHPHIVPLRNAMEVDGHLVIATPLGERSLAARMRARLGPTSALRFTEQLLDALAYAHEHRVIHCDIKPDNVILFPGDIARLADFGIAKVSATTRTIFGSGAGTMGYIAPEQAMGKPSFRSDVFSMGLVIYRMFSGGLPEWPFTWPYPGIERVRRVASPEFIVFLRRAISVNERERFRDGVHMRAAFRRIKPGPLKATKE